MKKEILLLSSLISLAVIAYLIIPISNVPEFMSKTNSNKTDEPIDNVYSESDTTSNIELNFDIVRLDSTGNVVIAGKTIPLIKVEIFDGNEKLADVISDNHGDWVWISDLPLTEGIKRLNLKYTDKKKQEFVSGENIIIINKIDKKETSKIFKYTFKDNSGIEVLNNDNQISGLALDMVEHLKTNKLKVLGRATPNSVIKIFLSGELLGEVISNEDGSWFFEHKDISFTPHKIMITTIINNEIIKIKTPIFEEKIKTKLLVEREIKVVEGNSLWRIARKTLGGGILYSEIYKNNIKIIANPNLIFPGQVFNIPDIKKR
ncbi:MAG: LysM peptidoglycan-binding domain-containing protein [Alphaproteobacteria bacterium]